MPPPEQSLQFGGQKRKSDQIHHTIMAVTIIIASTALAWKDKLSPETTLAAWGLAAAMVGTPIVVRRGETPQVIEQQG